MAHLKKTLVHVQAHCLVSQISNINFALIDGSQSVKQYKKYDIWPQETEGLITYGIHQKSKKIHLDYFLDLCFVFYNVGNVM